MLSVRKELYWYKQFTIHFKVKSLHATSFTSQRFIMFPAHFYQKDEREMTVYFQSSKLVISLLTNKNFVPTVVSSIVSCLFYLSLSFSASNI